jgi:hypothetical protein
LVTGCKERLNFKDIGVESAKKYLCLTEKKNAKILRQMHMGNMKFLQFCLTVLSFPSRDILAENEHTLMYVRHHSTNKSVLIHKGTEADEMG